MKEKDREILRKKDNFLIRKYIDILFWIFLFIKFDNTFQVYLLSPVQIVSLASENRKDLFYYIIGIDIYYICCIQYTICHGV